MRHTKQLYLSLYLELIPLPAAIQKDIVPVVRDPALLRFDRKQLAQG